MEYYLDHLEPRAAKLSEFLTVRAIRGFLEDEAKSEERSGRGWTSNKRAALGEQCQRILERPMWRELVLRALESDDEQVFNAADRAAEALEIQTWDYHWNRLQKNPQAHHRWFRVISSCDETKIDQVLELARRTLSFRQSATGPAAEPGKDRRFDLRDCVSWVVPQLGRFPGRGFELIEASLKSPAMPHRNAALRALSEWGEAKWPKQARFLLEEALQAEPDEQVRKWIEDVLAGRPLK